MKKLIFYLIGLFLFVVHKFKTIFFPENEKKKGLSYFITKIIKPIVHNCKAWMYDLFARWRISHAI